MKKTILALLLAVVMTVSLLPLGAMAAYEPNTTWYGDGSATEFTISTAAELAGLAELVNGGNSFSGKTIKLGGNIDLGNQEWTPIGNNATSHAFQGEFDGNGKVISNLKVTGESNCVGLFGFTYGANIHDLTLNNVNVSGDWYVGSLVGTSSNGNSSVTDVTVQGSISVTGSRYVGGLAGHGYFELDGCIVKGESGSNSSINCSTYFGGGIIGYSGEESCKFDSCSVSGIEINGYDFVGGITGIAHYGIEITNCSVDNSTIESEGSTAGLVAGVNMAGSSGSVKILDCSTSGVEATAAGAAITQKVSMYNTSGNAVASNTIVGSDITYDESGKVKGGTIEQLTSDQLADGMVLVENENGTFTPEDLSVDNAVAVIGSTPYKTLLEAINAAQNGSVIELKRDSVEDNWSQTNTSFSGVTINGNGHTLTVNSYTGATLNNSLICLGGDGGGINNLTIDLSGVTGSHANYPVILVKPGDKVDKVTIKAPEDGKLYGISALGSDEDNDAVTITNCKFENCERAINSEPTIGTIVSKLETMEIKGCEFTGCNYACILYAKNTTFTGNAVNKGKLNIMHAENVVDGNTFENGTRVQFFAEPKSFVKNIFDSTSYIEIDKSYDTDMVVDVSENYWGGGEPSEVQIPESLRASVTGTDVYYISEDMGETDLSTYCNVVFIYNNGAGSGFERVLKGSTITLKAPSRSGYAFLGWACSDGKVYSAGEQVKIEGNTTFEATWVRHPDTPYVPEPEEPEVPAFPFYDVPASAWYYSAVKYVYDNKLMDGVDTYVFAPNDTLTRAMVWTVIARMSGVDTTGGATWYAKAQEWVVANGISDGENPTTAITREEFVTMLWRLAGEPLYTGDLSRVPDAGSISTWAQHAMLWAYATGLVEGDETGALTPTANANRAAAAALVMRYAAI